MSLANWRSTAGLSEGKNVDIIELAGGCVCCSMTGEFEAAVREIIEEIRA